MFKLDHLKASLLLFGAYSFAVSIAKALHELGHAIYVWFMGGSVYYNINPFGTVYGRVNGDVNLEIPIYQWGGTISATLIGIGLLRLLKRQTNPHWSPVIMTGVVCVLFSGGNLIPGSLTNMVGDAGRLIAIGTPRWVIFLVGVGLLITGLYLAAKWLVPLAGLEPDDGLLSYILVFVLGFLPYTGMEILYSFLFRRGWRTSAMFGAITGFVVLLMAIMGKWRASKLRPEQSFEPLAWAHVASAGAAGLFSVLLFTFVF